MSVLASNGFATLAKYSRTSSPDTALTLQSSGCLRRRSSIWTVLQFTRISRMRSSVLVQ
jgi:hypothetical protein